MYPQVTSMNHEEKGDEPCFILPSLSSAEPLLRFVQLVPSPGEQQSQHSPGNAATARASPSKAFFWGDNKSSAHLHPTTLHLEAKAPDPKLADSRGTGGPASPAGPLQLCPSPSACVFAGF